MVNLCQMIRVLVNSLVHVPITTKRRTAIPAATTVSQAAASAYAVLLDISIILPRDVDQCHTKPITAIMLFVLQKTLHDKVLMHQDMCSQQIPFAVASTATCRATLRSAPLNLKLTVAGKLGVGIVRYFIVVSMVVSQLNGTVKAHPNTRRVGRRV